MLPLKYRLKKDQEIKQVLRKGKVLNADFLFLKFLPNRLAQSRFCFSVGIKVNKKTIKRNLIKRRLRYIVQQYLAQIQPGYDVIVFTKPEIKDKSYQEITRVMLELFRRSGLIK